MPIHTLKFRRDLSSRWWYYNPVLLEGEPGYEIDSGQIKIGDGQTLWRDLPYFGGSGGDATTDAALFGHVHSPAPHPVYDDGPSLLLLYQNAKV